MNCSYTRLRVVLVCILSLWLSSGCQKKTNAYYWGDYESLIYQMYSDANKADAQTQMDKLEEDIQEAERRGRKTPPGVFAHLGFIYASAGLKELAIEAFTEEKTRFPESEKFINGMMNRAFKRNES